MGGDVEIEALGVHRPAPEQFQPAVQVKVVRAQGAADEHVRVDEGGRLVGAFGQGEHLHELLGVPTLDEALVQPAAGEPLQARFPAAPLDGGRQHVGRS